ncbi:hypothetical protein CAEBREN_09266 [Caenorhabditis brenneri]|uniref:Sdz-33 F-box domain-containing protein n=1 Tax=Caenorhabditis brenneri TaxID=135651 RepID=G0MB87_CAEBE|nr:hypothetical protein CAEBREN_09266 [Caenorhabditis brenneri]
MANNNFRLLGLPNEAAKHVLKVMDDSERIATSFCSKRTKPLAVTRVKQGRNFVVSIGSIYNVHYIHNGVGEVWGHNTDIGEEYIKIHVPLNPFHALIPIPPIVPITWKQPGWSLLDRINHIKSLFPRVIDYSTNFFSHAFDLNQHLPLLRADSVNHLDIPSFPRDDVFNVRILNYFFKTNRVQFRCTTFQNPETFGKVAIRNMTEIGVYVNFRIDLDQILLTNCRFLHLMDQTFSARAFNKFLKLWRNGSNPNLKYFYYEFSDGQEQNQDINVILSGINARQLLGEERVPFAVVPFYKQYLENGFQIWDQNGRKGILECNEARRVLRFVIFD